MKYKIDYTNVNESKSFEPVPEGEYGVEIVRKRDTTTKEKGFPLVEIQYKIKYGQYAGRIIFDRITLFPAEEKGAGITKHFLNCIGEPYENSFEAESDNWIGKFLNVTVKIDTEYNNNKVTKREVAGLPF